MAHIGIVCPSETGHLNPMLGLGRELQKRGHNVTIFQLLDTQQKVVSSGLQCHVIGKSEFPIGSMLQRAAMLGKLSGIAGVRYTIEFGKREVAMTLRELPDAIKAAHIDILLIDQAKREAGSVAEFLDIPFISVCNALIFNVESRIPPGFTTWSYNPSWWASARNQIGYSLIKRLAQPILALVKDYRQQCNLSPHTSTNDAYSKLAQISQQPAEFEFPRQHLPSCFHFTGPFVDSASREPVYFPFEKLTGQPLIYASMGTLQNRQEEIFHCVAEACVGLDAQLIISLGGGNTPESMPKLPGTPLIVGYSPQLELLKRTTLTITHGGLNTVLESLSYGVSMVTIPITNDQPGVAARLAWTGAGEILPLSRLSVRKLRDTVQRVLTEDSYKKHTVRLQEAIRRAGGLKRAADIIEKVVSTGKPVLKTMGE
ncbi:glycosyltransferase [Scytonema sp. NUACC26]|uniref:glycosyltransferase n=1 Tax=Scytonema sp. NUACC26 TaxID=3140176 RepID=UPI0034DC37E4